MAPALRVPIPPPPLWMSQRYHTTTTPLIMQQQTRQRKKKLKPLSPSVIPPPLLQSTISSISLSQLFVCLLLFRYLNAVLVQTQFDPDEFWQGNEPAHLIVYGRGFLTWEWAPGVELRSWLHPLILSGPLWSKFVGCVQCIWRLTRYYC
jgi:hypothetical protein